MNAPRAALRPYRAIIVSSSLRHAVTIPSRRKEQAFARSETETRRPAFTGKCGIFFAQKPGVT